MYCYRYCCVCVPEMPLEWKTQKTRKSHTRSGEEKWQLDKKEVAIAHVSPFSGMLLLSLCLSLANAAMQVIGVSGVDAPAAVMVGSTYLSVAKPSEAKHRNFFCLCFFHLCTGRQGRATLPKLQQEEDCLARRRTCLKSADAKFGVWSLSP